MKRTIIIVSAPSGAGKSTLCDMALKDFSILRDSISYTTRSPRDGESDGCPYHFVSNEKFEQLIREEFFAEWAKVHGKYYGTGVEQLESYWEKGNAVIMDLDVQGAKSLKFKFPWAVTIFIKPPNLEALRQRITGRDKGKTKDLELRLHNASLEMAEAPSFDFVVVNDNIEMAYAEFKKIIEEVLKSR